MVDQVFGMRASRELQVQDAYAKQQYSQEQLAAKQAQDAAAAARTDLDRKPSLEEAKASTKKEEGEYLKSLFKGGISNLGLPVDLGTMGYNFIAGKFGGTKVDPNQPLGGEWFKNAFLGAQPTRAELAGFENGQWGLDPTTLVTGGLKVATAAAGAAKAGMIPLIFMKDKNKVAGLIQTYEKYSAELAMHPTGSPEWHVVNHNMYEETGGLMADYAGKLRWHVPDSHVTIKDEFVNESGNLKELPPGTTLGSILSTTDVFDTLHPMYRDMLLAMPINDLSKTLPQNTAGRMSVETGLDLGPGSIGKPVAKALETILHEVEHMFQFNTGSTWGASYHAIAKREGLSEKFTSVNTNVTAYRAKLEKAYESAMGTRPPAAFLQTLHDIAQTYGKNSFEGKPMPAAMRENIALFEKMVPGFKDVLDEYADYYYTHEKVTKAYKGAGGEVLSRIAEKARKAGYPLLHQDMPVEDMSGLREHDKFMSVPGANGKEAMPLELVKAVDLQERIFMLAERKGLLKALNDQSNVAEPFFSTERIDEIVDSISVDEIKVLIEEQARDAAQVGSKFATEWARGNYAKAIKEAGADLAKGRLKSDNPNAAFPSKGSRTDLDPTWTQALKREGTTAAGVKARTANEVGETSLAQSRLDMSEKIRGFAQAGGVEGKAGVTKADVAQRVPDSQGVKDVETGGGGLEPRDISSFGARMEDAATYAVGGSSEVWRGGRYNSEAAINRNAKIMQERLFAASKILPTNTSSKVRQEATPTFWAYDPVKKSVFAVRTNKQTGELEIFQRSGKGKMPENWRDMVDDVMTEEDLRSAVAKATWDRVTREGVEPIVRWQKPKRVLGESNTPDPVDVREPSKTISDVSTEDVQWMSMSPNERRAAVEAKKARSQ